MSTGSALQADSRSEAHRPPAPAEAVTLAIVVPCFDEEPVLPVTIARLGNLREQLLADGLVTEASTVHLVDDGSRDRTWQVIEDASRSRPWLHGIKLSRNRGHQNALLAGLLTVGGDAVVTMDADLQDDLSAIPAMLRRHLEGAEIVYGVRNARASDTRAKRITAEAFYRVLSWCGVDVVANHADFRLMGRRAIAALADFGEVNLFLRGIIPLLGFRTAVVEYERGPRAGGESKYPLRKMLSFAWTGITSLSTVPLRWIALFGLLVSVLSFAIGVWALGVGVLRGSASVPGWVALVVPLTFLGGVQLLSVGVLGEYVGKVYAETKKRPRYIIERIL